MDTTIPIVNNGAYSIFLAEEYLEFPLQREANVTVQSVLSVLYPKVNYNLPVDLPETEVQILKFPYTI